MQQLLAIAVEREHASCIAQAAFEVGLQIVDEGQDQAIVGATRAPIQEFPEYGRLSCAGPRDDEPLRTFGSQNALNRLIELAFYVIWHDEILSGAHPPR
jgi:hypothetical protein